MKIATLVRLDMLVRRLGKVSEEEYRQLKYYCDEFGEHRKKLTEYNGFITSMLFRRLFKKINIWW